jgi:hypothetical protein
MSNCCNLEYLYQPKYHVIGVAWRTQTLALSWVSAGSYFGTHQVFSRQHRTDGYSSFPFPGLYCVSKLESEQE